MRKYLVGMIAVFALILAACGGGETQSNLQGSLTASGATFPKAFYETVIASFNERNPNVNITYAGGGSGKGRTDLQNQVVDFAGSDGLVKDADKASYKGGEFLYFPTVAAPITIAYNLDTPLNLSPDTIAKIFQRQIKSWDDPAIAADNPGVKLTGQITVARRSDGSGTTENFTKFLVKASPEWKLKSGSTVEWPADTQAGNGNAGVAQIVKDTKGAIGYVDLSDAKATSLKTANVKNKDGRFVAPALDNATAALAGIKINPDLSYDPLWADGADAYPITAPTWILVYVRQTDANKALVLKEFLKYVFTTGQAEAGSVDYAQLPTELVKQATAQLDRITVG